MQTHDARAYAVLDHDIGGHGVVKHLKPGCTHMVCQVARESAVDAVEDRNVEQRHDIALLVAMVHVATHTGVAQQQIALFVVEALIGGLRDLLVRKLVQDEVAGFIPRQVVAGEVDELIPVVAGSTAEAELGLLDQDDALAFRIGFVCSLQTCKAAADDRDVGIIDLVLRSIGAYRCRTARSVARTVA